MIDRSFIGYELEPRFANVERGQVKLFCKATGETNPIYTCREAARAAGYPETPIPPTFTFCLNMLAEPSSVGLYEKLRVPLDRTLHGEQTFRYFMPICVGDTITFRTTVADVYTKKQGALEFLVLETTATNQHNQHVTDLTEVAVVRKLEK